MSTDAPPHDTDAQLRDITPQKSLNLYIKERKADGAAESTLRSHKSRIGKFIDWFNDETDYTYLNELDGFDLKLWKLERFGNEEDDFGEYSVLTVKTQVDTVRRWMKFNAEVNAVPFALPHRIKSPTKGDEGQRNNEIADERMRDILEYLDRYEYASFRHTLAHLLWYAILRVGAARSIDLRDIDLDDGYIDLEHRPREGTPLKKQVKSERTVDITQTTCEILKDYIEQHRHDVEDDHGRRPLFTTENGRASLTTLRNEMYILTAPCTYNGGECPHDKDPETCQAAANKNDACKCPTSESTHAVRRGSITWHLRESTPKEVISGRADVSVRIIDEHYNQLSQKERADKRREYLPDEL